MLKFTEGLVLLTYLLDDGDSQSVSVLLRKEYLNFASSIKPS